MILGASSILSGNAILKTSPPQAEEDFDFMQICGSVDLDEVNALNEILTTTQVYEDLLTVQTFDANTLYLGHLDDSLQFGNFSSEGLTITHWNILRREVGTTNFTLLAQVPNTAITRYLDIRAEASENYEYAVQSVSSGTAGNLIITEEVSMEFWGWSLTSLDYDPDNNIGTQFIFDVEVRTNSIKSNRARTQFDNYSKKPKVSYGVQEFDSSSMSFFPLKCNGNTIIEPSKAINEQLRAFIDDTNVKILKNGSGRQWYIDTYDFDSNYRDLLTNHLSENKYEQPYDVSFSWVEIEGVTS